MNIDTLKAALTAITTTIQMKVECGDHLDTLTLAEQACAIEAQRTGLDIDEIRWMAKGLIRDAKTQHLIRSLVREAVGGQPVNLDELRDLFA